LPAGILEQKIAVSAGVLLKVADFAPQHQPRRQGFLKRRLYHCVQLRYSKNRKLWFYVGHYRGL